MPPMAKLTTKAREALRRAHELAIERGQNHVNPVHLLCALVLQEESMVASILDKMEIDTPMLTDIILEHIETPDTSACFLHCSYNGSRPRLLSILTHQAAPYRFPPLQRTASSCQKPAKSEPPYSNRCPHRPLARCQPHSTLHSY